MRKIILACLAIALLPLIYCETNCRAPPCSYDNCPNKAQFSGYHVIPITHYDCSRLGCILRYHVYSQNGDKFSVYLVDNEGYTRYQKDEKIQYHGVYSCKEVSTSIRSSWNDVRVQGVHLIVECHNFIARCTIAYTYQLSSNNRMSDTISIYAFPDLNCLSLYSVSYLNSTKCTENGSSFIKYRCNNKRLETYNCRDRHCKECTKEIEDSPELVCVKKTSDFYNSFTYLCQEDENEMPPLLEPPYNTDSHDGNDDSHDSNDDRDNNDDSHDNNDDRDNKGKVQVYGFSDGLCSDVSFMHTTDAIGECEHVRVYGRSIYFKMTVNIRILEICNKDCVECNRQEIEEPGRCGTDPTGTFGSALYVISSSQSCVVPLSAMFALILVILS